MAVMWRHGMRLQAAVLPLALLALVAALSACTTVISRSAVPEDQLEAAAPYGIPGETARSWGDFLSQSEVDAFVQQRAAALRRAMAQPEAAGKPLREVTLALSGGGPDGAFGAGLLSGWTKRGDRPEFSVVTGISTGSIVALLAFLGPDYDKELKEIYTTYKTDQLLTPTLFSALTGGSALSDTRGYRRLIEKYVDDKVVAQLAEASRKGRALLIGTTNIDASRPVIWDVSQIAATGHPDARRLIQDIIQASSAMPALFPPVLIPVDTPDGGRYDEMHVDGGAIQQVMYLSPQIPMKRVDAMLGREVERSMYVVVNNKLRKTYAPVRPRILAIAEAAASSLIGGDDTGDLYKIFAIALRDDIGLNIVWIPEDFDIPTGEPFDPVYMNALYDLGYKLGLAGKFWEVVPPGYEQKP